jgi:cytochrome c peroxidase
MASSNSPQNAINSLRLKPRSLALVLLLALAMLVAAGLLWRDQAAAQAATLEAELQALIDRQGLKPLSAPPPQDPALVALGQALFFDKELSGNRDISCATCHHPELGTGDRLPLSIGTGGTGFGQERQLGENRDFVPRHASDLFNRGLLVWETMFWEGRVSGSPAAGFATPAGEYLPDGLDSVLAAQAMFPVTIRTEMRGGWYSVAGYAIQPGTVSEGEGAYTGDLPTGWGDMDVFGQPNELAALPNEARYFPEIWALLMDRLLAIPAYQDLFRQAYPEISLEDLGFQHAANALAAFEAQAFAFTASPWDRYLAGDQKVLSIEARQGALLFFGRAGCAECHSGTLLTDQRYYNIGAPQIGPGRDDFAPLDYGRYAVTLDPADKYAFRTPPLHNVALTAPYLHNGAYNSLEAVVRHHLQPEATLQAYDGRALSAGLRSTLQNHPVTVENILAALSPRLSKAGLSGREVRQLVAFLESLTDPAAVDLAKVIPAGVPSGLPVGE